MANQEVQELALQRWNEYTQSHLQDIDDPRALWIIVGGVDLFVNPKQDGPFYIPTEKPPEPVESKNEAKSEDDLDLSDLEEFDPNSADANEKNKRKRSPKGGLDEKREDAQSSKKLKKSSEQSVDQDSRKNLDKKSTDYSHYLEKAISNTAGEGEVDAFAPPPMTSEMKNSLSGNQDSTDTGTAEETTSKKDADSNDDTVPPLQLIEENANVQTGKSTCCGAYVIDGSGTSSLVDAPASLSIDKVNFIIITCVDQLRFTSLVF